jgi:hypothetical protein
MASSSGGAPSLGGSGGAAGAPASEPGEASNSGCSCQIQPVDLQDAAGAALLFVAVALLTPRTRRQR